MKKALFSLTLFFGVLFIAFAQTATIKGLVTDAETGETLPFCNVFVNNTTISTATEMDGTYVLSGLEPGTLEIGFSFLGYVAETKTVSLNPGGELTLNLKMEPYVSELSDVEIKASRDKAWERNLRKFENLFLGNDAIAKESEILNPWVIDFPEPEEKGNFTASSQQPLEIINNHLGYKIIFDLKEFYQSRTNSKIAGPARFEELVPVSDVQKNTWDQNRAEAYRKSPMNMFRSIVKGEQEKEGFFLYGDKPGGSPSMNMRSDIFANELGNSVIPYESDQLVKNADKPGEYLIHLKGRIEIHYQKGYSRVNTYADAPYPVSWLEVAGEYVRVKENGFILNPDKLVFSGDMERKRISTLLPLDYDAEKAILLQNLEKTAQNYQEKIYLHTDKPYYYAGDEIFFKGYLNYGNPYLRNELSKILHVELVDADRNAVLTKKFKIQDGLVYGNFYLPKDLEKEKYFLRAYTNWSRNYGPDHYFTIALPVLTPFQRVNENEKADFEKPFRVQVLTDQQSYSPREKVTLSIKVYNKVGRPVSSTLSLSVTDQTQILPVSRGDDIKMALKLEEIPETMGLDRFSYPVEVNLKEGWTLLDRKDRPTSGEIVAFINDFEGMVNLEANREGEFYMEGMEFYGTMKLAMQASDGKGRPVKKITKILPSRPPMSFPKEIYFPETEVVEEPIRPLMKEEEFEELEEIVLEEEALEGSKALYGKPTYIVKGEDLFAQGSTTDLVNSLAGKVPSMRVTVSGATGKQQIRIRSGSSVIGSLEPLIMLDGSVMVSSPTSTAADNLRSINPFNIDRVEVVTRTVSMLGDDGRNGVIAVYLKEYDPNAPSPIGDKNDGSFAEFEIEGFQAPIDFYELDYEQEPQRNLEDKRQTLFWNPYLVTDENGQVSVSFYTNEIAGPMTVSVRGMGLDGIPISGTFTINPN